ncbi:MAG: hypothetical protein [Caudoviricetes sp.]|nr:MAG: hypothetical protein [Caudoviricetes sp.]
MAIETKNPHSWFVTTNDEGKTQTVYNHEHYLHNYPFGFEINSSDSPTPSKNSVTLYNMSKEHRDFYEKGQKCYVAFNWGISRKILAEGFISKIEVNQSDGVTDTFNLTFTEGTDYNNVAARKLKVKKSKKVNHYKTIKKTIPGHYERKRIHYYSKDNTGKTSGHYKYENVYVKAKTVNHRVKTRATKNYYVSKTFKKGTTYKKVITGVAAQAGIKISKIDLAKNPKMKKAFVARGKPLRLLQQLVKPTGSKLEYIQGKLEIVNPKNNKRTWYVIDDDILKSPPTFNESNDDDGTGTWEMITPLIPDITLNVGITMKSRFLKGKFYVKALQHSSDGENPETHCSLKPI